MNILTIIPICLMLLFRVLMLLTSSIDVLKSDGRFIISKVIDCLAPFVTYVLLVIAHHYTPGINANNVASWGFVPGTVIMIVVYLDFYIDQAKFFAKFGGDILGKSYIIILVSMFSSLLIGCTMLNYLIYMYFPQFYGIPSSLNHAAVGFEFLYYTFTLMITYGTNSIVAVHVVSKTIQIIEMALFYVLFGMMFVDLIAKAKQPAFDFESYFKSLPQQEDTKSNEGAPTKE